MNFSSLNLFIKTNEISIQRNPVNGSYLNLFILSENDTPLSAIRRINFPNNSVKNFLVPNSMAPFRTYMNSSYKQDIQSAGLIPIKANINEISKFINKHLYIDATRFIDELIDKWNITNFSNTKFKDTVESYMYSLTNNTYSKNEKVLLYTLDLGQSYSDKLINKKILPIYIQLLSNMKDDGFALPFDKIIFCTYNSKDPGVKSYVLIYDKSKKMNIAKFRDVITSYTYIPDEEPVKEDETDYNMNEFQEDEINKAINFRENTRWRIGSVVFLEADAKATIPKPSTTKPATKPTIPKPSTSAQAPVAPPQMPVQMPVQQPAFMNPLVYQGAPQQPQMLPAAPIGAAPMMQPMAATPQPVPQQQSVITQRPVQPPVQQSQSYTQQPPASIAANPSGTAPWDPGYNAFTPPPAAPATGMSKTKKNLLGAAAVAGAGIAAFMAFKKAQNKKMETWYATNCEKLEGTAKKACVKHVNNIKLNNLNQLLAYCNGDQECQAKLKGEIEGIQRNIKSSTIVTK